MGAADKIIEELEEEEEAVKDVIIVMDSHVKIIVMDSHVNTLNARMIEEELGGLLFTGQCEKRSYNSGQWPEAKFPKKISK